MEHEQDALEKLGWKREIIDEQHTRYSRDKAVLIINLYYGVVSVDRVVYLFLNDILALAEIIKEMEKQK